MTISMRRRQSTVNFLVLTLILSTSACAPGLAAQTSTSGCRPADQVRSPARLTFLRELVSSSDSDHVATRQDLGLPVLKTSKVTLVTRQRDCQRAVEALNNVRQEPGTIRQVWLYALGTEGYALDDPGLDQGRYSDKVLYFFVPNFTYKRTYSGF
jgi:hypothetical protein